MNKWIAIAALVLVSTHAAAEDKLTQEQACNYGYVSAQCEAVDVPALAAVPAKPAQLAIVAALYQVDIPYLNDGYFGSAGE